MFSFLLFFFDYFIHFISGPVLHVYIHTHTTSGSLLDIFQFFSIFLPIFSYFFLFFLKKFFIHFDLECDITSLWFALMLKTWVHLVFVCISWYKENITSPLLFWRERWSFLKTLIFVLIFFYNSEVKVNKQNSTFSPHNYITVFIYLIVT